MAELKPVCLISDTKIDSIMDEFSWQNVHMGTSHLQNIDEPSTTATLDTSNMINSDHRLDNHYEKEESEQIKSNSNNDKEDSSSNNSGSEDEQESSEKTSGLLETSSPKVASNSDDEMDPTWKVETGEGNRTVSKKQPQKYTKGDQNEQIAVCPTCNKTFRNNTQLLTHQSMVHKINIHYCEFCSKEFKNKVLCKQHVQNVHEALFKEGTQCDQCDKVFNTKGKLYSHTIAVHAESDDMYCHVCGGKYKNKYALKRHVRKCEVRPKKTPVNYVPGNKVGEPGYEDTYYDDECDRTYLTYKSLRVHKHNSHSNGPIICKICEAALKTKDILKVHLKMKHGIEDKELLKGLTWTGNVKRGRSKMNENSEMEMCLTCGKEYLKSYYLSTHKDRCAAGFITRGKPLKSPVGSSEPVRCVTCGQEYSQTYYHRAHRDRCAAGLISTRRPLDQEAFASLTPDVLAMYAVPKPAQPTEDQIKKHEEKVKKWRQLEEEQRKEAELSPKKKSRKSSLSPVKSERKTRIKSGQGKVVEKDEEAFAPEADDMDDRRISRSSRTTEEKDEVKEEDSKNDPSYPDVKLEAEDSSEDDSSEGDNVEDRSSEVDVDNDDEEDANNEDDEDVNSEDDEDVNDGEDNDIRNGDKEDVKKEEENKAKVFSMKVDPSDPPDWRQFCHLAGPGEKKASRGPGEKAPREPKVKQKKAPKFGRVPGERRPVCTFCGITCTSPKTLSDHLNSDHSEECITCSLCNFALKTLPGLEKHLKKKHNLTKEKAKEKCSLMEQYRIENGLQLEPEGHICDICLGDGKPPRTYRMRHQLNTHKTLWHVEGTYLCITCGASFDLKGKLKNHNNFEHNATQTEKERPCPHCGIVVKCLQRHIKDVHGEKQECVCPQCAKVFTKMGNLRSHVKDVHEKGLDGRKFVCHLCSKEVSTERNLKQHLRLQHYEMPKKEEDYLSCPECGGKFAHKTLLNSHITRVHLIDNRQCEICGGSYQNKTSLMKHMKNSHSGPLSSSKIGKGSYRISSTSNSSPKVQPKVVKEQQEERQLQQSGYDFPTGQEDRRGPYNNTYPPVPHFLPHHFGNP